LKFYRIILYYCGIVELLPLLATLFVF